ncbi:TPA: 3-methyl-2-oxobutanoate hydroxymethyltransferase [Candidatus Woesearchaeota archaeon]|nr:3-methyl-2-oxobutanoate hydroxymethyltransferase [Candidatus Woesearchaeota archaeon]HII69336.1 3-methyl-2-oxobutanoate hydroxymethyltransferase [Candidatus Woesearchaeota archaeon]
MDISAIIAMKGREKIAVLTAYEFAIAQALDPYVDILLVGDSMGMVVYGEENTRSVTLLMMQEHTQAVAKAASHAMVVADLPYKSDVVPEAAVSHAKKLVMAGARAVKPEGKPEIVYALVSEDIAVMGHVGLLPQTAIKFEKKGKTDEEANEILSMALAIEKAGAFSVVLECIPNEVARVITAKLSIPTIGIGAGKHCDGQVLVSHDFLGLYAKAPSFAKKYCDLRSIIGDAAKRYRDEVKGA